VYFSDVASEKERKKEKCSGSKNRTRIARLIGRHADHSATTPCWRWAQTYALRTKPGSFKGGNKSPHHIFAADLTKVPTVPELHKGVPKVLRVHSVGNRQPKQHATVWLLPRQRLFKPDNLASLTYGDI